jgi:hypothetical protein
MKKEEEKEKEIVGANERVSKETRADYYCGSGPSLIQHLG